MAEFLGVDSKAQGQALQIVQAIGAKMELLMKLRVETLPAQGGALGLGKLGQQVDLDVGIPAGPEALGQVGDANHGHGQGGPGLRVEQSEVEVRSRLRSSTGQAPWHGVRWGDPSTHSGTGEKAAGIAAQAALGDGTSALQAWRGLDGQTWLLRQLEAGQGGSAPKKSPGWAVGAGQHISSCKGGRIQNLSFNFDVLLLDGHRCHPGRQDGGQIHLHLVQRLPFAPMAIPLLLAMPADCTAQEKAEAKEA